MEKKFQKGSKKFYCKKCDYSSNRESQWRRHLSTTKHKMDNMDNIKKVPKFQCFKCDYVTSRKSQWKRHIVTRKHALSHMDNKKFQKRFQKVPKG